VTHETEHAAGTGTAAAPLRAPQELAVFLEPDQLLALQERPVPRAALGPRTRAALWALRIFALAVSAMVVYAFFASLGS
jgi:hypothetical protein